MEEILPSDTSEITFDMLEMLCPSATPQHRKEHGIIFGVVLDSPSQPQVTYLPVLQPATPEILAFCSPSEPDEVFRIAAPCARQKCRHFNSEQCGLIQNAVQIVPIVMETLPPCRIRSRCQWWHQEGKAACLRCPQVVTLNADVPEEYQSLVYQLGEDDV